MPRLSSYVTFEAVRIDLTQVASYPTQVGLFSAIVTAFLVDSLSRLQPDDSVRTNDLLVNLTEIILFASGTDFSSMALPQAAVFVPDPSDVRENVFWSISLVLSVRYVL